MGLLTPITFTIFAILSKYLCSPEVGFIDTNISISTYLVSNCLVLIVALIYWTSNPFSSYCFWLGFIASSFDSVGMVGLTKAYATGPGGPVAAICSICNIAPVAIEAYKHSKRLSNLETYGLIIGVFGSCMLVMSEHMEKYVLCCFFRKKLRIES